MVDFGIDIDEAVFGPEHGPQIKRRALRKLGDALADQLLDLAGILENLETEGLRRAHDALAMEIEIGCDAFEGARAVEDAGAEPWRMGHRTHDHRIAFVPGPFEEGDGPGTVLPYTPSSVLPLRIQH